MQQVLREMIGLLVLVLIVWLWESYLEVLQSQWHGSVPKAKRPWHLKARTPQDCQGCRLAAGEVLPDVWRTARPWGEVKSLWGVLKVSDLIFP
jgi:hypothetical protein